MADFIAVIRRAVDGLSDNTPEMRARVYDKARTAVQRQLENMKPRPPEEMLRRQMDKLESAIREVEEEHSEALPAEESFVPETLPEPGIIEEAPPIVAYEEPAAADEAVEEAAESRELVEPVAEYAEEQFEPETAIAEEQSAAAHAEPEAQPEIIEEAATVEPEIEAAPSAETTWPVEVDGEPETGVEPEPEEPASLPAEDVPGPAPATLAGETPQIAPEEAGAIRMPRAGFDENEALADFGDLLDAPKPAPAAAKAAPADFSWDAPFDDLPELQKPVVPERTEVSQPAAEFKPGTQDIDAEAPGLAQFAPEAGAEAPATKPLSPDPLAELDDLIGYSRGKGGRQTTEKAKGKAKNLPSDVSRAVSKLEGKSFRTQPRQRKRNMAVIAFAAIVIAVLGGGALALWLNFDKVSALFGGEQVATPGDKKPAEGQDKAGDEQATPAEKVESAAEPDTSTGTEVATLGTPGTETEKFTQRLLPDGSETASESDTVKIDAALPEGKTVAGQTVASQPADGQPAATPDANNQDAAANDQPGDAATQAENPTLGIAQKMFLYEERLGQGTPTAVTGTVTWSVKNEGGDSGKPEPVIQANIDAPERGMKILVTFKRNTDSSLPASHLIELVFQLPKDFEGGNIESVDRIAMKPNEQNIGNPLIAVPAKITDDFHMIALNDDKDAIARNLELMRSRPWIDIPITYRNGRKALITIEKGTTGTAAFEKALGEWAALGSPVAN